MVLDINHFNRRKNEIRKHLGIPTTDNLRRDEDVYSVYVNPGFGTITGVMDNESQQFYKVLEDDNDLRAFVRIVNYKEYLASAFMQTIELEFKQYRDREIEHFHRCNEYEDKISKLENEIQELRKELQKERCSIEPDEEVE